jgi:hypothetical protein
MTYREKAEAFRHLAYRANGLNYPPMARWAGDPRPERPKWRSLQELEAYLREWGGCVKKDIKRRRGFLVVDMNEGIELPPMVFEVPMDFAMRVLALGGFP